MAFPAIGDTLLIATDRLPYQIIIGEPGPARLWDFTSLKAPFAQRTLIVPFTNRSSIPELDEAEAVVAGFGEEEVFVRFTADEVLEVGRKIPHPMDESITINGYYMKPRVLFQKLQYLDKAEAEHILVAPFHALPEAARNPVERTRRMPGEIRFVRIIREERHADAWGALRISSFGRYNVLRQKVVEEISYGYEVKDDAGNWVAVKPSNMNLPTLLPEKREYYIFWSDELRQPPAIVFMEQPGLPRVHKIMYKPLPFNSRVVDALPNGAEVIAYPNPTFDFVRFDFMNLPDGNYFVDIYNILGMQIRSFEVDVDGYTTSEFDLSDLKKGTYIYRIRNEQNRTITSKRLIIIQP